MAEIDYAGPEPGRLTLAVPRECASGLAANLLGLEPGSLEDPARARDSVAELLNIVAGVMMPGLFGVGALVQLGIPRVFDEAPEVSAARLKACAVRAALRVDEEHRVELAATPTGERQ
ncbi:MAG: chemotaxis protein CheX [Myxococcota bacterium]